MKQKERLLINWLKEVSFLYLVNVKNFIEMPTNFSDLHSTFLKKLIEQGMIISIGIQH